MTLCHRRRSGCTHTCHPPMGGGWQGRDADDRVEMSQSGRQSRPIIAGYQIHNHIVTSPPAWTFCQHPISGPTVSCVRETRIQCEWLAIKRRPNTMDGVGAVGGKPALARLSVSQGRFCRLQFVMCQRQRRWTANPFTSDVRFQMCKTLAILCLLTAMLHGPTSSADERSDSLSAQIDKLISERWSQISIGHDYSDRRVRKMRKQLSRISFPARDGTVARSLRIADPKFFVSIRECGFSLISGDESGRTRTHEFCRLNRDFELVVIRLTVFRDQGKPATTELSAEIRRIDQSK